MAKKGSTPTSIILTKLFIVREIAAHNRQLHLINIAILDKIKRQSKGN